MDEWTKIVSVANIFNDATKMLNVMSKALIKQNNQNAHKIASHVTIPVIVLKAFACEMYLKAFISLQGSVVPKVHDLAVLFRNVNKSTRIKLYKKMIALGLNIDPDYNQSKVDDDINKIAHSFEEWRYFYEKANSIEVWFLDIFLASLTDSTILPPISLSNI